jgi:hypothetical protein
MPVIKVGSLKELATLLPKHQAARQRRLENAIRRTARRGVGVVKKNVPVAFGELREDIEARAVGDRGAQIFADAPHAAAIEVGSRPHWVPLEALVKWVRLRGMQGLSSHRALDRLPGRGTAASASRVAEQIRNYTLTGAGFADGNANSAVAADAPLQIAKQIQLAIAKGGTKPRWYMRQSQPEVYKILDDEIQKALPEKEK